MFLIERKKTSSFSSLPPLFLKGTLIIYYHIAFSNDTICLFSEFRPLLSVWLIWINWIGHLKHFWTRLSHLFFLFSLKNDPIHRPITDHPSSSSRTYRHLIFSFPTSEKIRMDLIFHDVWTSLKTNGIIKLAHSSSSTS